MVFSAPPRPACRNPAAPPRWRTENHPDTGSTSAAAARSPSTAATTLRETPPPAGRVRPRQTVPSAPRCSPRLLPPRPAPESDQRPMSESPRPPAQRHRCEATSTSTAPLQTGNVPTRTALRQDRQRESTQTPNTPRGEAPGQRNQNTEPDDFS